MSKPIITLVTSTLLLAACAAAGAADIGPSLAEPAPPAHAERVAAHSDPVRCDVRVTRTAQGVAFNASASAVRDFEGEYSLRIIKSGANSSDISQGGPVSLRAGERVSLAGNEISLGRGERVRAELTLIDERGEVCARDVSL